jgi:hypothetical protein
MEKIRVAEFILGDADIWIVVSSNYSEKPKFPQKIDRGNYW